MRVAFRLLACVALVVTTWLAVKAEETKYTVKDVMKTAMKGGLCKKVADGQASDEEKKQLLAMFESMAAAKPAKGDEASWKEKTGALVEAAKKGDGAALKKAANCKACHDSHK